MAMELDSNFAELQAINKVINLGTNDFLIKANVDHTYFHDPICAEAYKWIETFIDKYDKVPDYSSFYSKFSDLEHFASQGVKESPEHIVESIKEYHLFYRLKGVLTETSNKAIDNANDAYDYLLSKVTELNQERPVDYYDIVKQAKVRYDDWDSQISGNHKELLSTGFPELDHKIVGLSPGEELVVLFARTGVGKEQPLYSKVLTPTGFIRMGDIKVGDEVIVSNGDSAKVSGVFPQGEKDVYRVTLEDGTSADCGLEHLWEVFCDYEDIESRTQILTTRDLIENFDRDDADYYISKGFPADIQGKRWKLDPYVIGFLLGTKTFLGVKRRSDGELTIKFACDNSNIANTIIANFPGCSVDTDLDFSEYTLYNLPPAQLAEIYWLFDSFGNKVLDGVLLNQSVEFRKDLFTGILDSGSCVINNNSHSVLFYPSSVYLREGVAELCHSLAVKCCDDDFELRITVNCKLPNSRTLAKYIFNDNLLDFDKSSFEKVVRVEKIGRSECQCIMVDHPLHTYITDDYIVTHNTWILMNALHEAWKRGMDVGIIEPEMTGPKLGYRFDTLDSHVSNSSLTYGKSDKIDKEKYKEYAEKMSDRKAKFIAAHPRDFGSSGLTVSKIKSFCKQTKIKILGIDGISYIKDERGKPSDSTTTTLTNISEDLMDLSIELGIPVIVVVQSNREGDAPHGGRLGLENIRGSDGIAYSASMIFGLYKSSPDVLRIQILKNRNGPTGITLAYNWNIDEGRFSYLGEGDEDEITGEASENSYQPPQQPRRDRSQDIDYSSQMSSFEQPEGPDVF